MDEIEGLLRSVYEHLEATGERPLSEDANRLLGEAESIAEDAATGDLDRETARGRVETILELLDELDGTGDETADEHVDAARRAAERILDR